MATFNQMSLADTYGRGLQEKQQREANQLAIDAREQENKANEEVMRYDNTKFLYGAAEMALQDMNLLPALVKEGVRRGVLDPEQVGGDLNFAQDPERTRQELTELRDMAKMALQGGRPGQSADKYTSPVAGVGPDGKVELYQFSQTGQARPTGISPPEKSFMSKPIEIPLSDGRSMLGYFDPNTNRAYDLQGKQIEQGMISGQAGAQGGSVAQQPAPAVGLTQLPAERAMVEAEGARGRVQDPTTGEFAAVPGTQADVEAREAADKRAAGAFMKSIQAQTVFEDTTRFRQLAEAGEIPFGKYARAQEWLDPMLQLQGYRDGMALIESVKGNVGIDSLLRIKASGAGLGQVPQTQLDMLSRLLGELDLKQSAPQFMRTWNRMEDIYKSIMESADEELSALERDRPQVFGDSSAVQQRLLQQARQAIEEGRSSRAAVEAKLESMGIDPGRLE